MKFMHAFTDLASGGGGGGGGGGRSLREVMLYKMGEFWNMIIYMLVLFVGLVVIITLTDGFGIYSLELFTNLVISLTKQLFFY